jgi:hypothetical protein
MSGVVVKAEPFWKSDFRAADQDVDGLAKRVPLVETVDERVLVEHSVPVDVIPGGLDMAGMPAGVDTADFREVKEERKPFHPSDQFMMELAVVADRCEKRRVLHPVLGPVLA